MWKVYQSQLQNPDFATVISPEVASAWRQLDLSAKGHMQYIAEAKTDVRPQVWTWLEFQVSRLFVEPYSKLVGANQWVSPGRFEDPERRLSNQDLGISQRELGMTSTVVPIWEVSGWILPVTGCAIIMIGLFRYLQSRPQDKHLWACFFNKIVAGSLLISLAVVTEQRTIKYMPRLLSIYYLPLAGGIVIGVVVMDFILIYLFIRSTEKKRHAQTQEGDAGELHPLPRSDSIPHASETNPEIPNQAIPSTVSHNNDSGQLASSSDQSIQQHASEYKQYLVPFSSSPFKAGSGGQEDRDHTSYQVDNDDTPLGERPPNWLELSLDLAWSASFATLTTNTDFTYWRSLGSYAVFFSIMWQLWANQVTYDIQFYTNDWFHRLVFVSQLGIYAALASFNDKFDVLWRLRESGRSAGFFTLEDFHQMRLNSERKTDLSFDTISIILGISRTLLVVQYFRVIYYRYKQHSVSRSSVVVLAAFTTSSGLFFMSSSLNRIFQQQWVASVVRLILWTLAATIEITTHTLMSKVAKAKLRGYGSLSARLGTLTVIVIGEGLNGIYSALQEVVIEPGFGWKGIGQVISVASIIFCTWLLYFNGFRERLPATKLGKEVWFNLHLPFHLSIILLLEGLKVNLLSSCLTILLLDKGEGMPQDIMGLIRHKITPPMGLVWIFPVSGGTTLLTGLLGYILRQPQGTAVVRSIDWNKIQGLSQINTRGAPS
ncbi:hypothetical protein FRC03_002163 [Tulasnella sp. 419]|nr:hypothetical protein FRC03_002163 [Tulasnella sp. 419]